MKDDGVESCRSYCALMIGLVGMSKHRLGHSQPRVQCPPATSSIYSNGAHNHGSVGAPDQGARSNGNGTWSHSVGRPLGSIQHSPP
jgi:hypothetical protein